MDDFGEARLTPPLDGAAQAGLVRAIGAALGPSLARAAARRISFAEAIAEGEGALSASPTTPGDVTIEVLVVKDDGGQEVFAHRAAPAAAAFTAGASVMAAWQRQWHPGRVLEVAGDQLRVEWEGGSAWAWVPLAHVRSRS